MGQTVTRPVGSPTAAVKTSKVAGRHELHFTKLAEIQADAESFARKCSPAWQLDVGHSIAAAGAGRWKCRSMVHIFAPISSSDFSRAAH